MTLVVVALSVASVLVAPVAHAATSGTVTGLTATGGYNSVRLTWSAPTPRTAYRGVTIWRYEGNRSDNPPHVLVATLNASATSYVDGGLAVPSTGLWAYDVFTRDAAAGPIDPQYASAFLTSAVSGRVTDAQGNGVGGVDVVIGAFHAWSYSREAVTAADGTWLADGVDRGSATTACFNPHEVTEGSSTTGYQSQCFRNTPSLPGYGPGGTTFATQVGVLTRGVDAVLQAGGAVSGIVRDQQGRPLANAGVTVVRDDQKVFRTLVTGSDGSYSFGGLPPGNYASCGYQPASVVRITPASPTGYVGTCSDGSVSGTPLTYFSVAAGAAVIADIALAAGGAITGRVTGPGGSPVVGLSPEITGPTGSGTIASVSTDSAGNYAITGLSSGRYTVCFDGTGSSGTGASFDPGLSPRCWKNQDPSSPTTIDVTRGQTVAATDVRLPANPTISGTVTDQAGHPIGNAFVAVDNTVVVATDPDGTYRLGTTPGTHTVCFDASQAVGASRSGYTDQCWNAQPRSGGSPTPVQVARGARVTGIDAALVVAAGVQVKVVDAAGTPLRDVTVYLYRNGEGPNGRTDGAGVVTFTRVYLGNGPQYIAYLGSDSYWNATPAAPYGYATTQASVVVKPGLRSVRIVAPANGTVSGTVRDATGAPLAGVQVDVTGSAYAPSYSTAADGTWSTGPIPPGTYTVCFSSWVGTAAGAHDATSCWDAQSSVTTATPVVVADRAAVTGIDGALS